MSKKTTDNPESEVAQKTRPGKVQTAEKAELHVMPIEKPAVTRKVPKGSKPQAVEKGFFRGRVHSNPEQAQQHPLKRSAPTKEDRDRAVQDLAARGMKLPRGIQEAMDRHFDKDNK